MNRTLHHAIPQSLVRPRAFTLVEILISILILALGVLGLGALFPVIIREQRLGTDAASGVSVSNSARATLTQSQWGSALRTVNGQPHPLLVAGDPARGTQFLWNVLRDQNAYSNASHFVFPIAKGLGKGWRASQPNSFQYYGQGEWYTTLVTLSGAGAGTLQLGYPPAIDAALQLNGPGTVYVEDAVANGWVDVPVSARLHPSGEQPPQFVWDVALQRVTNLEHTHNPQEDAVRAAVFVRRIDPRIRVSGNATSLREALAAVGTAAEFRFPVGEDPLTGNPTLDGTGQYSGIKTCDIEFFYVDTPTDVRHQRDRLYQPQAWTYGAAPVNLARMWAQMKQPGQKLVDNLGNIYTVVGSGTETGVGSGEYLKIDPPVPESVTAERASPATSAEVSSYLDIANPPNKPNAYARRAIRQVAFTPQIPVSVTLVELAKGSGQ